MILNFAQECHSHLNEGMYSVFNTLSKISNDLRKKIYWTFVLSNTYCKKEYEFSQTLKLFFSSSWWCQLCRSGPRIRSKCPSSPTGCPTATPWRRRRGWQPQGYSHAQNYKANNTYCNSKKSTTTKYQ